jgi:putative transposase
VIPLKHNLNIVFSAKYHVVFSPKYRRGVLVNGVDVRLKQIVLEIADERGFEVIEMEVMPDHVHLVLEVDPAYGITRVIGQIKGRTSRLLRQEFPVLRSLPSLWTNSTFISTVGGAPLEILKRYIQEQKNV